MVPRADWQWLPAHLSTYYVETGPHCTYEYRRMKRENSIFARCLKETRLRLGIPQDKLGVMIGIDESSASARISRYESGTHAASYEIAARLAETLGVPTAYLFCDDEELAELILAWGQMSKSKRVLLRKNIRRSEG